MAPFTERNVNTPTTTPLSAKLTMSQMDSNDENATPQSATSKLPPASRLMSHTKSSAARIASPITPQNGTPSSKLPRLTHTPTQPTSNGKPRNWSNWSQTVGTRASSTRLNLASPRPPSSADTVTIHARNQNNRSVSRLPSPVDKPLPPRPVAQLANSPSPTKDGRSIIDASEQPLRKAPGTPQEEEWKALSPARNRNDNLVQGSTGNAFVWPDSPAETPSSGMQSGSLRHSSPMQSFSQTSDEYLKPFPLRTSSLRDRASYGSLCTPDTTILGFVDHGKNTNQPDERPHSPAPLSFSQPLVKARNSPRPANPHATASRIPIHDPKRAPQLINIRGKSMTGNELPRSESVLTFGGQRLNSPEALEALDQGSPKRKQSGSSRRTVTSTRTLMHQGSVLTLHSSRREPSAIMEGGPSKRPSSASLRSGSSSSYSSEVDIKPISGQLLSSSFPGSTLSISLPRDAMLLGKSSKGEYLNKVDTSPVSPEHAGSQLDLQRNVSKDLSNVDVGSSVGIGATAPASSGNASFRSRVRDLLNHSSIQNETPPSVTTPAQDPETQRQITATLSFLEGTAEPPEPVDSDLHAITSILRERRRQQVAQGAPMLHPAHRDEKRSPEINGIRSGSSGPSGTMRGTTPTLPQYTPRYTKRATPSAQGTGQQTVHPSVSQRSNVSPEEAPSIGFPSRIPSKASAILGPGEETRGSIARTPGNPPIPVSQFSTSTTDSKRSANKRALSGFKGRVTHSQSKSKAVIHNLKGLFSGDKREHKSGGLVPPMSKTKTKTKVTPTGSPIAKGTAGRHTHRSIGLGASNKAARPMSVDEVTDLMAFTHKLIEEGRNETNGVKKEQLLSLAAVITNAIANSRETEKSMQEAKRAADLAHHWYQMTQCSLAEMGRLMAASHNMTGVLRRLAARTIHC